MYRENRFKDMYKGLHFGTLDINLEGVSREGDKILSPSVRMNIFDHDGKTVMTKEVSIALRRNTSCSTPMESHSSTSPSSHLSSSLLHQQEDINNSFSCTPIWGEERPYQKTLFVFCMAVYLFFILSILLTVVWFIFASVFYIFFEREYKRRERIEEAYLKKKNN
jgi:hypothetical protein